MQKWSKKASFKDSVTIESGSDINNDNDNDNPYATTMES